MPRPAKKPPNRADGRYEKKYSFEHITGDPKRKSFYSRISFEDCDRQAKEYEAMLQAHILVGDRLVTREATFKEWAETWLNVYKSGGKVRDNTYIKTYENIVNNHLIPYFDKTKMTSITQVDIENFVSAKKNLSQSALNKMRVCLNAIFKTAIKNKVCYINPVEDVLFKSEKDSKNMRIYTSSDVKQILSFCDKHKDGIYIRILLELGLRCSELCGLMWDDIDFKKRTVTIQRAVTDLKGKKIIDKPKSKSSVRTLPISSDLLQRLKDYPGEKTGFILKSSKTGEALSPLSFKKRRYKTFFDDLAKEYPNIKMLNPHELRHTCGTLLYAKSHDIYAVSKYLGHSSVEITTKLYVHDSTDVLRKNLKIK